MAAEGLTNREIGQKLFLSHRTVGSHLYRMFPKLGISPAGSSAPRCSHPTEAGASPAHNVDGTRTRSPTMADSPDTILFIHGLWMTPRSWENFASRYESRGYKVLAPGWPGTEGEVEALRGGPRSSTGST